VSFIAEVLGRFLLEVVLYGIGRAFLFVLAPHIGNEHDLHVSDGKFWKWRGWTFEHNGRRHFHEETVQLVGLLVIAVFAALAAFSSYLKA
jgi:hypothetical protein